MLMLGDINAKQRYDRGKSRFWVKDVRRRSTTVILASRAAPPQAAGSQKYNFQCAKIHKMWFTFT